MTTPARLRRWRAAAAALATALAVAAVPGMGRAEPVVSEPDPQAGPAAVPAEPRAAPPAASPPSLRDPGSRPAPAAPRAAPAASAPTRLALPVTVEAGTIRVRAQAGLSRDAHRIAERAVHTLPRIAADLPDLPAPERIEIRLVRDTDDLPKVAPPGRGAPRWAAGVAYPDVGVVAIALYRGGHRHDIDLTLDHELAHLALGAAIPDAPRWLHEGFAWQHASDFDFARLETLAGMAWFGNITPLDELEAGFPAAEAPASRAYAESYDFVGFLADRGRWADRDDDGDRWPFRYFLRALANGATPDQAAHEAFGADLDELFDEWRSDLVRRYMLIPASVFATGLWVLAALLLILAWLRRRRRARATMERWTRDEEEAEARTRPPAAPQPGVRVVRFQPPPHLAWPGSDDPLAEPADGDLDDLRTAFPDAVVADGDERDDDGDDGDGDGDDPPRPRRWLN